MKALAFVLLLAATGSFTEEPCIAVTSEGLGDKQANVFTFENGVKITLSRRGEARHVDVERGRVRNRFILEPVDGKLTVTWSDTEGGYAVTPERILVDGVPLTEVQVWPPSHSARYWICPKDQTMLRVPHSKHSGEFKCPVDGTPMKPAVGRRSEYYLLQ